MIRKISGVVICAFVLAACANTLTTSSSKPRVVATTTIIGNITRQIAGDRIDVITLLAPGVDPHDYEPVPIDLQAISQAQLILANGAGLEPWLNKITESTASTNKVIYVSNGLTTHSLPNSSAIDPHLWFDVNNAIHYTEQIRDGLIAIDPANAETYRSNAAVYSAQLKELDTWISDQVNTLPVDKRLLITNHDTFGYFAARYGFTVIGTIFPANGAEASPSAQQIADLVNLIKHSQAKAIFTENTLNPELANTIAQEAGVKIVTELYTDSLGPIGSPASTYIDMMRYDVQTIVEALK
jgi:manganese/iron transport system substrate-binding protein